MLSNNGLCHAQMGSTILVLVVNSAWFRILHSYTPLLPTPILMHSWHTNKILHIQLLSVHTTSQCSYNSSVLKCFVSVCLYWGNVNWVNDPDKTKQLLIWEAGCLSVLIPVWTGYVTTSWSWRISKVLNWTLQVKKKTVKLHEDLTTF